MVRLLRLITPITSESIFETRFPLTIITNTMFSTFPWTPLLPIKQQRFFLNEVYRITTLVQPYEDYKKELFMNVKHILYAYVCCMGRYAVLESVRGLMHKPQNYACTNSFSSLLTITYSCTYGATWYTSFTKSFIIQKNNITFGAIKRQISHFETFNVLIIENCFTTKQAAR